MADKIRHGVWKCREGFYTRDHLVKTGAVVPRDVPYEVLDGCEQWFDEVEYAEAPAGPFKVRGGSKRAVEVVEAATAAPGETRKRAPRSK